MEQIVNNYYYNGIPGGPQIPQQQQQEKTIDWKGMYEKVLAHRKQFLYSLPVAFVAACIYMISVPNYYDVQVKLAPELGSGAAATGGLSSLMSSFGIGGSLKPGADALQPTLYPDLMNSKTFLVSLFDVKVQNEDSTINTTYYDYLTEHQKAPWWSTAMKGAVKGISSLFGSKEEEVEEAVDPFHLTKKQDDVTVAIGKKIVCDVDKKTAVITINVTDQDPVICANIADSTCRHLQDFITDYRTKKARKELQNIQAQFDKTRIEYERAKDKLAAFNNSHWAIVNEDAKLQQQYLQNDMQLKYSAYSAFSNQLVAARTKVEESTPVYTVLDGATVPIKKSGPHRAKTVLMLTFLVFLIHAAYILRDEIKEQIFPAPVKESPSAETTTKQVL